MLFNLLYLLFLLLIAVSWFSWQDLPHKKNSFFSFWYLSIKSFLRFSLTLLVLRFLFLWIYWYFCYLSMVVFTLLGYDIAPFLDWYCHLQGDLLYKASFLQDLLEHPLQDEVLMKSAVKSYEILYWIYGVVSLSHFLFDWIFLGIAFLYVLKYGKGFDLKIFWVKAQEHWLFCFFCFFPIFIFFVCLLWKIPYFYKAFFHNIFYLKFVFFSILLCFFAYFWLSSLLFFRNFQRVILEKKYFFFAISYFLFLLFIFFTLEDSFFLPLSYSQFNYFAVSNLPFSQICNECFFISFFSIFLGLEK